MHIGPICGQTTLPVLYALDSDESHMQRPQTHWTRQDIEADKKYRKENTAFLSSLICTTKKDDCFILPSEFQNTAERELLTWHISQFERFGLSPTNNFYYSPIGTIASKAKSLLKDKAYSIVVTTCFSHITNRSFPVSKQLSISKQLNAKEFLYHHAEKLKLKLPKTLVISSESDLNREVLTAIDFPKFHAYLKSNGLGGGNNVVEIVNFGQLKKLIKTKRYAPPFILQKKIDTSFDEIIISLLVKSKQILLTSSRYKMTDQNTWYGNIFHPNLKLDPSVVRQATSLANKARKLGFHDKFGLYFGIDAFHNSTTKKAILTEVNARYLGSTPIELLLSKLSLLGKALVVSMFDYISETEMTIYQQFIDERLYNPNTSQAFSVISLGFSAFQEADGSRLVYYLVMGDIELFMTVIIQKFSNNSFVMSRKAVEKYRHIIKN